MGMSRSTIRFLLIGAGAGILFSWILDVVRSGFHAGSGVLALVLLVILAAGVVMTYRTRGRLESRHRDGPDAS